MRPRAALVLVSVLVLGAAPAAAKVDLVLPEEIRLSQATFLAGRVDLAEATFANPVVAWPHVATANGTLTVCPDVLGTGGIVRPVLIQALQQVQTDCDGAQYFPDPILSFGPDSQLAFVGDLAVLAMPGAALLAPFGDANGTLAMTLGSARHPLVLAPQAEQTRFAAATAATSVAVIPDQGDPVYFNGTSFGFILSTGEVRLHATALATALNGTFHATVGRAERADLAGALADPFALLDAQESLLGADAREPRGNVSRLLREFGRVPAYVNGALVGRLDGSASGRDFHGGIALVRGGAFTLQRDGAELTGSESPRVAVAEGGVSFGGGLVLDAPWIPFAIVWAVALLVLLVRRRAPQRPTWMPAVWAGAFAAGVLLFDRFVLEARFGAGAMAEAGERASPGIILSLVAFELVLFSACYLALALPARLLLGRVLPQRLGPWPEVAWALLWAVLPLLFPGAFFSLGYDLARL